MGHSDLISAEGVSSIAIHTEAKAGIVGQFRMDHKTLEILQEYDVSPNEKLDMMRLLIRVGSILHESKGKKV